MKIKYIIKDPETDNYYNGSNLQYEPVLKEEFGDIGSAMIFDQEHEVISAIEEIFDNPSTDVPYLTYVTIYRGY